MPTEFFDPEKRWPKRRFNLICGASAAGKTRWIMPRLIALHKAGSYVLYTCCDRTIEDAKETLVSMGYSPDALPMESFQNEEAEVEFDFDGLKTLVRAHKIAKSASIDLLFVESIGVLANDMNKAADVVRFSRKIHQMMDSEGLSIWGSSWCPKVKENAKFTRTRDNIMGSAAWPGIAGTIVFVDSPNGDDQPERSILIMPRNGAMVTEHARFDSRGRLEPYEPPSLDGLLLGGGSIYTSDVVAVCDELRISSKSGQRWIRKMLEAGKLEFIAKGEYRVSHSS